MIISLPFILVFTFIETNNINKGKDVVVCSAANSRYADGLRAYALFDISKVNASRYFDYINGDLNKKSMAIGGIPTNANAVVIDTSKNDPHLIKIYLPPLVQNSNQYLSQYYWIWDGFLCE
jgi:hypothetical protein